MIRATVTGLHAAAPQVPTCAALAASLVALRDSLPAVAAVTDSPTMPEPVEPIDLADANAEMTDTALSAYGDLGALDSALGSDATQESERLDAARQQRQERRSVGKEREGRVVTRGSE